MNSALPITKINIALGKSATQSSVSQWSSAQTVEEDAGVATNGDTVSPQFFHTEHEEEPWWQVDLGEIFVIEELRIFNRRDFADRLRRFTVLVSQTGGSDSWLPIYRKADGVVFGQVDNLPLVITPEIRSIARFVRIRLDEPGVLHFRECEVSGYVPGSAELTMLRDQMEQVGRRLIDEQAAISRKLADGRSGRITKIDSFSVFVDTDNYSPMIVRALAAGV